jgi:hypothetical protein
MVFIKSQHSFGKTQESLVLPILQNYFNSDIKTYETLTSKHDFYDDEYNYELKSRTNKFERYPTTLFALNKIQGEKKLRIIIKFTDVLTMIEYNEEKFNSYEKGYTSADEKEHYFIPITDLAIIPDKNNIDIK